MARPKKVVEEVVSEEVQTEEIVQNNVQNKTVAMVRDETYPEPRSADVHIDAVEEWKTFGWTEK